MKRLTDLTPTEKQRIIALYELTPTELEFIDEALAEAERRTAKKPNRPNRHIVINKALEKIALARYYAEKKLIASKDIDLLG